MSEFDGVLEIRLKKIQQVLAAKANEYASGQNRYHNFYRAAEMLGCTPEQALLGMLSKHLVSVMDMVEATTNGNPAKWPGQSMIDEKIGDSINYLILLEGLLLKRAWTAP